MSKNFFFSKSDLQNDFRNRFDLIDVDTRKTPAASCK